LSAAREQIMSSIGNVCSAAVLHVRRDGNVVGEFGFGRRTPKGAAATPDSIFDIASLTKLFVGSAFLSLVDKRAVALDDPVAGVIAELAGADTRRSCITFRQLLTHTSGLPAHVSFREEHGARAVIERVCATPLASAPGTGIVYSDLGFMLVGEAVARLAGQPLEDAIAALVTVPIGAADAAYHPSPFQHNRIVCTERDGWRKRLLCGEVHDENSWAMGGVGGHAGMFATAHDIAELGEMYRLSGCVALRYVLMRPTAHEATREQVSGVDERRGLAWALKSGTDHSCGARMSWNSFGHTGFTGSSLWVDPDNRLTVAFLTNRVYFSRDPEPIRRLRAAVHDAVFADIAHGSDRAS